MTTFWTLKAKEGDVPESSLADELAEAHRQIEALGALVREMTAVALKTEAAKRGAVTQ